MQTDRRSSGSDHSRGVAAIILAAGMSSRFGEDNKLLVEFEGQPLVSHVFQKVRSSEFSPVVVVVPPGELKLIQLANDHSLETCKNFERQHGMGASIACGAAHLDSCLGNIDGVAIFLGDMPAIELRTIELVRRQFLSQAASAVVRPSYEGKAGHPVIFPTASIEYLKKLDTDVGARNLINENNVKFVDVDDSSVIFDIDLPEQIR